MAEEKIWRITAQEMELVQKCMDLSLRKGASQVRITLSKSMMDLFSVLNGTLDKVTHSGDRSISLSIIAAGRYGSFSTNRLDSAVLDDFIAKAIATVKTLAPDEYRKLPDPSRTAKDALTGMEPGLFDDEYSRMDASRRLDIALATSSFGKSHPAGFDLVSEELEYSDSIFDTYLIDSNGLNCRHTETSFDIGCETTVADDGGNKFSGYWWDSSPFFSALDLKKCCPEAMRRAAAQIGPKSVGSGKYSMVVESEVSSRLLTPVLNALNAYSIQQQNSFLSDSLGKRLFPEGMTIMDLPRVKGAAGARLFDSEGVATKNTPIIEDGVVKEYFVNTYMSGKMGIAPTVEDSTRACMLPYSRGGDVKKGTGAKELMGLMGRGIFVTGFNGGNSNSATGDFSYGVEGFAFENGCITHPVRGMVITGNLLDLWNSLAAAGDDSRPCMTRQIPSLAFENVDFSA